jgi:uncharacterized repeat protein (TIGR03803 family)
MQLRNEIAGLITRPRKTAANLVGIAAASNIGWVPVTRGVLTLGVICLLLCNQPAHAQTESVLHNFSDLSGDGKLPWTGLILDKKGNLYGTTPDGGDHSYGIVFELSPPAKTGGAWTETVLYSFGSHSEDGEFPYGGLLMDKKGNLYGTTESGGAHSYGGTVFELSPPATKGGAWTETVLYSFFSQNNDAANPYTAVIMDKKGNLYGTTPHGAAHGYGAVFELSPPVTTGEAWTESILYSFAGDSSDYDLYGGLTMDKKGNLYGTEQFGGSNYAGFVYELSPPSKEGDSWTETVLYNFDSQPADADGSEPLAVLILDKKGNLYGTTYSGGSYSNSSGTVFELSPPAKKGETWTETVLHSFGGSGDGAWPEAGLILDTAGNLYGTTAIGGAHDFGALFELSPPTSEGDTWSEKVLYSFSGGTGDGGFPQSVLALDKKGNLYGTTTADGTYDDGIVFEVTP